MEEDTSHEHKIDLDLYSRQLYVLDMETMVSLTKLDVLVYGLNGLGTEIAKNLILAGPRSVHVYDEAPAKIEDMSAQFYISKDVLGKKRSEASVNKLRELNPYVKVAAVSGNVIDAIPAYQAIVVAESIGLEEALKMNNVCREQKPPVKFVMAQARGLAAQVFVDFGDAFTIRDPDGEESTQYIVSNVTSGNPATVAVLDDGPRIEFVEGDFVKFDEVEGINDINGRLIQVKKNTGPHTFQIDFDSTAAGTYVTGGLLSKQKCPKQVSFKPLKDALRAPGEFVITDFAKMETPGQLHLGFWALAKWQDEHGGSLPSVADVKDFLSFATALNDAEKAAAEGKTGVHVLDKVDAAVLEKLARHARGEVNPMCAFLGGVVAQEVLKCTGKFTPLNQWLYFDAFECLPEHPGNLAPTGSRYDNQIAVFGQDFQKQLGDMRVFIIGAGALGCEFLKNFAMMGVGTGNGSIIVTDMDNIEKSNLNRQFLFRDKDIGSMKSTAAVAAANVMNDEMKLTALTDPVGNETEDKFDEHFWTNVDVVVNALDNIKARLYVDGRCVLFKRPLLESGTLGTKANTQVVLPHKTESYGSSADPPEKSIPVCTLKHFPHAIEHTIEWARDVFGGLFTNLPEDVNRYLDEADYVENMMKANQQVASQRQLLEGIHSILRQQQKGYTFQDCVQWAREEFEDMFVNRQKQLLFNFPLDHVDRNGVKFWSGPKRAPTPALFQDTNDLHMDFIVSAANLRASVFGLDVVRDVEAIRAMVKKTKVEVFTPKQGVKIKAHEKDETQEGGHDDDEVVERLSKSLPDRSLLKGWRMIPASFEKDDDSNFHIDFITAASNLRAMNYSIKPADRQQTKRIAGKIIPAIATTTAMITGLVCLEFYKIVLKKEMEQFKNSFVNLAINHFVCSEPMPPAKNKSNPAQNKKAYPEGFTLWDLLVVDKGDMTFDEFLKHFEEEHKLTVVSMACGVALLYNSFLPACQKRRNCKIAEYVKEHVLKAEFPPKQNYLELSVLVEDPEDDMLEVEIPPVKYMFR